MSDSMLKRVLQQTVNNHEKGLCIVDLPTGSGKSYTAKNILYDALLDTSDNRKYICITSARKNKLYDELNDMCTTEESKALFNRQVIDLQANRDMISSTFSSINVEDIKDEDIRTKLDKLDIELKKDKILKENARNNKCDSTFFEGSMLKPYIDNNIKVDILISNPPYIKETETIESSVYDYEPHVALFGGQDGLKFYQDILMDANKITNKNALIFFEMGYDLKESLSKLVKQYIPDSEIEVFKDINNKDRMMMIKI